MICRTFFCEDCYRNKRPKSGDFYSTYSQKNKEVIHELDYNPPHINRGFTPHYVEILARNSDEVMVEICCTIIGCGITLEKRAEEYYVKVIRRRKVFLSSKDFAILFKRSDYGYRLEDE